MKSARMTGGRLTAAIVVACCLGLVGAAQGQVIISQVYGGGNNAGALYNADFVELYNTTGAAINFATTNYSLHYRAAAGTSWTKVTINAGTIPANGYYLIRTIAAGTTYGILDVPSPDLTSASPDMSATAGVLALYNAGTTVLVGSAACPPAISSGGGTLTDIIGYGTTATCSEPTATNSTANNAPAPDNRNAIIRRTCGTGDGNNNGSDYFVALPNPRNTGTTAGATLGAWASGSPSNVRAGDATLLTVVPRNCTSGAVLGATVNVNLSSIGLSNPQAFVDDGTSGDEIAGDGTYSYLAAIPGATTTGTKTLQVTVTSGANTGGCILPLAITASGGPANDSCRTALAIAPTGTPGTSGSYGAGGVSQAGNLTGAQAEYNASMTNFISSSGFVSMNGSAMRRGLWYTCIGTGTTMTAELCATSPTFDNVIQVLCGSCDGLSVVSAGDDECGSSQARATWCSTSGQTYYVWVASFTTGATTNAFSLKITDNGTTCTGQRPCTVCTPTCVGGSTDEGETAPGIAVNDGCDASSVNPSTAQSFTDVTVGSSVLNICGTLRAVGASSGTAGTVDNDWYRFQAGSTDTFSATATGQLPLTIQLRQLSGTGTCTTNTQVAAASSDRCATATISTTVTSGNWYALKVFPNLPSTTGAAGNNSGFFVGATSNRYVATMQIGAPPANDVCGANVGSFTIAGTGGTASSNSNNATDDAGLPASSCPAGSKDVWHYFTPATSGNWLVSTCGSSYDTIVNVYSGACASLTEVGCNDDTTQCTGGTSEVRVNLTAATLYRIRIASKSGSTGSYSISVQPSPVNDDCASAININTGICATPTVGYGGSFQQSNSNATTDGAASCAASSIRDLWYTFTPAVSGVWTVETCGTGATIDTVISWYTGTCGSLVETDCNDNAVVACTSAATHSRITPTLAAGTTYYMRLATNGTVAGTIVFTLIPPGTAGNDVCSAVPDPSYTIPGTGGTASGSLRNANSEGNAASSCFSGTGQRDVFYYFTPSVAGCNWNFSTCGCPDVDTAISIHTACPTAGASNQLLPTASTCSDQGCGTGNLTLLSNVSLTVGTPYIIRVAMWSSTATAGPYTLTVSQAPPSNDACSGATTLTTSGGSATATANNVCATDDGLTPSCGATSKDLWWLFTTTASQAGNWRIDTCGSAIDTVLTVYTGVCGTLTEVASGCNDDATGIPCSGPQSAVTVSLAASTTYRVRVASKGVTAGGAITLNVLYAAPPANDNCTGATGISPGSPGTPVAGNTTFATNDGSASCDPGGVTSRDIWYQVVLSTALPANQNLVIDTCGSAVDTVLSVYTGACGSLTEIACNDDCGGSPCGATSSCVTLSGLSAGTYVIRVSDKGLGAGGVTSIKASFVTVNDLCAGAISITCPSVTTGTTVGATIDSSAPSCAAVAPSITNNSGSAAITAPGVWYSILGTGATVTADTITGTSFDSKLSVYTGPDCSTLSCVTMNDDISSGFRSKVAFATTLGQQYWILVHAFSTNTGTYSLNVYCDPTPANDQCGSATVLTDSSGSLSGQTTVGSTATVFTPVSNLLATCATNANDPLFDVWYTITACATGNLTVGTCGTYDTLLSVHTACPTATVSNQLTPTASSCNDNGAGACAPGSQVTVAVTAGTPYWIRVAGGIGINAGGTFTLTWSLPETDPPVIGTCSANQTADADASCQAALPNFTTGVSATDNCTPSGNLVITQSPLAGTLVGLGVTNVTVTVADTAGNQATCSPTFTVSDVTAPTITVCASNQSASADASCQAAVPDFTAGVTATDNCTAPGSLVITQSPTAGTLVGLGGTAITITVADGSGNSSQCNAMFTVSDTTAPTISGCPGNIGPVPTDPGQPTAVVSWTAPTAADNCLLASFVSTHNPGDAFPVGVTNVTYTATDGAGLITTCTFSVTVVDNESPQIVNCPSTITQDADAGLCSTTVTWTPPTATDNQPGVVINQTQGPAPGSTFPVGTTHIQYTATDVSNNTATCDFDVIVVDNQDPQIAGCPSNISLGTEDPNCSAVATWTAPTASDNCAIQTFVSTHNSGDTFPLGMTTVTYTATDVNGRTATCNFTVTVSDDDAPTITTCASNQSASADANCQAAVPDFTSGVVATDNCTASGSLVITQSPTAGTLVGLGATGVTITVKDAANNMATCNATFTVNDTTAPSISGCPSNITSNTNAPNCAAVVSWTAPTATDNCGASISQTQGPASGSTFANGSTTTIEYTATDGTNSTVCSFTVTVTATPDLNNDTVVTAAGDLGPFVQVLLGLDTTPLHVYRSDTNCDGVVNGRDIPGMVDALIP